MSDLSRLSDGDLSALAAGIAYLRSSRIAPTADPYLEHQVLALRTELAARDDSAGLREIEDADLELLIAGVGSVWRAQHETGQLERSTFLHGLLVDLHNEHDDRAATLEAMAEELGDIGELLPGQDNGR